MREKILNDNDFKLTTMSRDSGVTDITDGIGSVIMIMNQ